MLQDLEGGRALELEAVVGAVVELGERLRISISPTPLFTRREARYVPACTT